MVARSLSSNDNDLSKFECLAFIFLNNVDVSLVSCSRVYRSSNDLANLLVNDALLYNFVQEWTSNIRHHVASTISIDFNNT